MGDASSALACDGACDRTVKLHIGAAKRTEGWSTLDIMAGPEVDFVGDCRDLSQFPAGSIETIYASHVLEHVDYMKGWTSTLKEWFRALKPGGAVMISVPDLEILCRLFVHPSSGVAERYHIMRMMFGGQTNEHDFHYGGFFWEVLGARLSEAGFVDIRRVPNLGVFDDTSKLTFGGVPISLNVIAKKPG